MIKFSKDRTYNWLLLLAWALSVLLSCVVAWVIPGDLLGTPYVILGAVITALNCLFWSSLDRYFGDTRAAYQAKLDADVERLWHPKD